MLCTKREVLEHLCGNTNGCVSSISDNCEEIGDKIAQRRPPLYSGKKWHDDVSTSWVMNGNAFHRIHLTEDYFNTTRISRDLFNSYNISDDHNHLVDIYAQILIPYIRNDVEQNNHHTQRIQELIANRNEWEKSFIPIIKQNPTFKNYIDGIHRILALLIDDGTVNLETYVVEYF